MIKYIIEFALKKPILNHLLLAFLFMLSVFSYQHIAKEIFPPANMQSISVSGSYLGASSELLDKIIVEDLENDFASISSVTNISTTIKNGFFRIVLKVKNNVESKDIISDVKNIIAQNKTNLPSDMDELRVKEVINKFPLITLVLNSSLPKEDLLKITKDLKRQIVKLKDLAEVNIWGDTKKELEIVFNEDKIKAYSLSVPEVTRAVAALSNIFPLGIIKDKSKHYYLGTFNGEKDLNKIQNQILYINNQSLYLKDIAAVNYILEDKNFISHFNGIRDISIGINKSEEGDAISLTKEIKRIMFDFSKKYPEIEFNSHTDTSVWIKNRFNTVVSNILFGLFLLFLALLFFINARIAIVVAIGIPTSFMIALIAADYFGYSLNMLSLLGALLALGMLVDEAIVVGENIYRHLEMGKSKYDAALDGALEVYPAVLTATATTIFAFLPILMMTGETGKFMKILPIMISILLIASLFEAFFFLPLHAKELYNVHTHKKRSDIIWDKSKKIYKKILNYLLEKKYISFFTMVISILFLTYVLAINSKFTFMPEFDTTQVFVNGSVGVGKQLLQTEKLVKEIEDKILKEFDFSNNLASVSSVIGLRLDGKNQIQSEEFYFQIFVNLNEKKPSNLFDKYINPYLSPKYDDSNMIREKTAQVIQEELKVLLKDFLVSDKFAEIKVFVQKAGLVKNDFELALSGDKIKVSEAIKKIKNKLHSISGVSNIADDILEGNVDLKFKINSYGQSLALSEEYLIGQIKPMYFSSTYSKMFDENGLVNIIFKSINKDLFSSLNSLEITLPNGNKVLLKDVVTFHEFKAYSQIFKENSLRIVSLSASLLKVTSNEVYKELDPLLKELKKDITIIIKGEEEENQKVQKEMMRSALLAVVLIFISLVFMFNSLVKPLIIISTIPLSILGVIIGHIILGINITMPSLIGIVGLAGVIVNDGIIMMDFIKKSKNLKELEEYALMRLRPILLTSLTTILGLSTLIFFASGQALILQPMAVALGFGILFATILNLYYVPMLYRLIYLKHAA
ncbi:MAG: efflux RND transporter permease subunit [Campylobacteraceae bacterium]|nr:efflux RND transporter permease subunit [Campylobacteraceae bacterium]